MSTKKSTSTMVQSDAAKARLEMLNKMTNATSSFDAKMAGKMIMKPRTKSRNNKRTYSLATTKNLQTLEEQRIKERQLKEKLKKQQQKQIISDMNMNKNNNSQNDEDTKNDNELGNINEKLVNKNENNNNNNNNNNDNDNTPNDIQFKKTNSITNDKYIEKQNYVKQLDNKDGFLKKIFHRNSKKKKDIYKKVNYQVSKKEKFELYSFFKPTKLLGEGAYAAVCEVIDQRTNEKKAIKKNRDVFSNISDARRILREIKLMLHFDHPNVMSITDVIPPDSYERETYKNVYLIMPRMDTTLSKVIRSKQVLSERHVQYFIYQMALGLQYMHSGGVIHRDLKPENILVNAVDCKIKITDFGLARGVIMDDNTTVTKLTEYVVTRWYRAPEVMCSSRLYDEQIDTWALGCISAELYTRKPIFKGRNHIEQLNLIFHYCGTPHGDLDWIKTPDAKKWISGMKKKSGQDWSKILGTSSHNTIDFITNLLILNPYKRMKIKESLKHPYLKEFYREKDIKICPKFEISFEFEATIKTAFGVRHMMYEELNTFHKNVLIKEQNERVLKKQKQNNEKFKNNEKNNLN